MYSIDPMEASLLISSAFRKESDNCTCQNSMLHLPVTSKHTSLLRKGTSISCATSLCPYSFTMKEDFLHLNSWPPGSLTSKLLNRKNLGRTPDWSSLDHMLTSGPITVKKKVLWIWFDLDHVLTVTRGVGFTAWFPTASSYLYLWVRVSLDTGAFSAHECGKVQVLGNYCISEAALQMTDGNWHINTQGLLPMGWQGISTPLIRRLEWD